MDQIYWIEPDGTQHYLMDIPNTAVLADGIAGWDMPPIQHIEEKMPLRAGARFRTTTIEPRDIDLPLHIAAANSAALHAKVRDILSWFYPDPKKGPGILRVVTELGDSREIRCRYSTGLQGDERQENSGINWRNVVITLRAHDPYWYASLPTVQLFQQGAPVGFLGNPFLPLKLTRTDIFSAPSLVNLGDTDAWPVWIITGPMTDLVLSNLTANPDTVIDMTYPLATGETITIDTTEDKRSVTKNDGTNLYGYMTAASYLWPLVKGTNALQIQMGGATVASRVQLAYTPRFLGF